MRIHSTQEALYEHQKILFHSEGDEALAWIDRACGMVSLFGDIKNAAGYNPEQLPLGDTASAAGADLSDSDFKGALLSQILDMFVSKVQKHPEISSNSWKKGSLHLLNLRVFL